MSYCDRDKNKSNALQQLLGKDTARNIKQEKKNKDKSVTFKKKKLVSFPTLNMRDM